MGILPIGFFAPLPLAIMIPFMAAQSFAMGHAFGTSFQYGKRKISSMSNEEFNALSATDLHGELQADIRAMIPDMNTSFKQMERFQIDIINSMVNTLRIAAADFLEFISGGLIKAPPAPDLQTDTSLSNIDFSGGTFDVGSSRGLPEFYPRNQKSYEQWLKDNKVQETIDKLKEHKHTVGHHFQPTTQKQIDTTRLIGAGVSKEADLTKKQALTNNLKFWKEKLIQQKNVLTRLTKLRNDTVNYKGIQTNKAGKAKRLRIVKATFLLMQKQMNIIKDTKKKIANILIQLKNVR